MLRGISRYPSVGFLCSTTLRLARGSSLTSHELESLAETAELVLVGAYDEESFVASHLAARPPR